MGWITLLKLCKRKVTLPCSASIFTSSKYFRHKMITRIPCYNLTVQTHYEWERSQESCQTNSNPVSLRNTVNALTILLCWLVCLRSSSVFNELIQIWIHGWMDDMPFLKPHRMLQMNPECWARVKVGRKRKQTQEGGSKRKRAACICMVRPSSIESLGNMNELVTEPGF